MVGKSKKTRVITFRIEHIVYAKLKSEHPNMSKYLREKVKRDVMRKGRRKG